MRFEQVILVLYLDMAVDLKLWLSRLGFTGLNLTGFGLEWLGWLFVLIMLWPDRFKLAGFGHMRS